MGGRALARARRQVLGLVLEDVVMGGAVVGLAAGQAAS